ncbi:MAG: fasciclin domain-containing protein [Bacteroidetes bacterium]|nr:fasciclin domain-containing protein [Bacteroidota bacterium]
MKKSTAFLTLLFAVSLVGSTVFAGPTGKAAESRNIVTVAVEAGSFNTLAKALTEAGLVGALQADGPFTVFAPTDDAFAKLPAGTLDALLKDKEALKEILLYHVVQGEVSSKNVVNLTSAETLSGKELHIAVENGVVKINSANVISADVHASNGVIHVIDEVLIPHSH